MVFLHLNMFCAFQFFHGMKSTFVQFDKNCVFYTWKCYLPEKYLCTSWPYWCFLYLNMFYTSVPVEKTRIYYTCKFFDEYLPLFQLTRMVFLHLKMFLLREEYTPLWELTKWCFLHLKILYNKRMYTSVRVFFDYFHWKIYTSVRINKNDDFYTKNVFYSKNIHLFTFTFYVVFSTSIPNWTIFVKEVFWFGV